MKGSYRVNDRVMHRDPVYGLWYLGTVARVDGNRYYIRYVNTRRPDAWANANELLHRSALLDVDEETVRGRNIRGIGGRAIRVFDRDYPSNYENAVKRFREWNRENIVPMRICDVCQGLARDFIAHNQTHGEKLLGNLEDRWADYKPPRLIQMKTQEEQENIAKRFKSGRTGYLDAMMVQGAEPRTPRRTRCQPRRNVRCQPRRNIQFTPRSQSGRKRKLIMIEEGFDEEPEDDPLNTALTTILEEDLEDDPQAGPSYRNATPCPRRNLSTIKEEDFEDVPEAGPSNPCRSYRSPTPCPRRYFDDDDDS